MAHVRKQIRSEAVIALQDLTITGSNVFEGRTYELGDGELPGLIVKTEDEITQEDDQYTMGQSPTIVRLLELVVDVHAKVNETLDSVLDSIAVEVESALAENTFGGLAKSCRLVSTQTEKDELEKPTGRMRMTFNLQYITATRDPETAL